MASRLIVLLLGVASAADDSAGANPIRKVVSLMQNMQKEIEEEGAKEKVLYDKFMCFCDNGSSELVKAASDARAQAKELSSKLESGIAEKAQLAQDIKSHETDLAAAEKDLAEATNIRNNEQATYDTESGKKAASEAALGKAIPAIEKGLGGASLMQWVNGEQLMAQLKHVVHSSPVLTEGNRATVIDFLQGQTPGSSEILGMLKAMKDELTRNLAEMKTANERAQKGFSEMKATKQKEIAFADESIESKKERSGTLAVEIVQDKDGAEDATAEAEKAEKFAATLSTQCAAKKKEWAERSKMRSEEIAAISQAIGILNDDDALDVFKKAVPSALMQTAAHDKRRLSLLQAKRVSRAERLQKADALLLKAGSDIKLFTLRSKLREAGRSDGKSETGVDFGEIIKMIDGMVEILGKDNKDDAKHKDWCIGELTSGETEKANTQDKLDSIASGIEELTDSLASTTSEITSLTESIAALDKDVAEATETRKAEHEDYIETTQLSETAVQLISKAKNRLQKFYNPTLYKAPPKKEMTMEEKIIASGSSALMQSEQNFDAPDVDQSFVQVHRNHHSKVAPPEAPETFGAYEKKSQKSGGVMALMDMIVNEMKASMAEGSFAEKQAQKEYVELMADSQAKREQDSKSLVDMGANKAKIEESITTSKEDQHTTMLQLENIHDTLAKLHGSCDFLLKNFELRLAARTAEIEGLKNAKAVLSGASFS